NTHTRNNRSLSFMALHLLISSYVGRLRRVAHADEVGGDAAAPPAQVGEVVASEVGGGRVAVQENDEIAPPFVRAYYFQSPYAWPLFAIGKGRADHRMFGSFLTSAAGCRRAGGGSSQAPIPRSTGSSGDGRRLRVTALERGPGCREEAQRRIGAEEAGAVSAP